MSNSNQRIGAPVRLLLLGAGLVVLLGVGGTFAWLAAPPRATFVVRFERASGAARAARWVGEARRGALPLELECDALAAHSRAELVPATGPPAAAQSNSVTGGSCARDGACMARALSTPVAGSTGGVHAPHLARDDRGPDERISIPLRVFEPAGERLVSGATSSAGSGFEEQLRRLTPRFEERP
jgi:hypothetical protein